VTARRVVDSRGEDGGEPGRLEAAARPATVAGEDVRDAAVLDDGGTTADDADPPPGLFRRPWFWGPILPLFAADLWSKASVFAFLESRYPGLQPEERAYTVWRGPVVFELVQYKNTGTVWGLAQEFTQGLIALRIAALFVLAWFAWRTPATRRLQQFVLGMVFAGAAGNLWDNLTEPDRGVRDFLRFYSEGVFNFPAFNVADSCITVGAFTLAFLLWRDDR
jgi:lipoprotein signal peptidase